VREAFRLLSVVAAVPVAVGILLYGLNQLKKSDSPDSDLVIMTERVVTGTVASDSVHRLNGSMKAVWLTLSDIPDVQQPGIFFWEDDTRKGNKVSCKRMRLNWLLNGRVFVPAVFDKQMVIICESNQENSK
jgi:hypothetical protein